MRWKRLAVKMLVYLAFAAWLGGIVFLVGYRARNPVDSYSNSQSQERPTQEPVTSFQQRDANPRREQADDHQGYTSEVFEPMTLLTALLVIGVGITAYIYWRQLKKMEETVALVVKQGKTMEGQLTAMQGTLSAIERQESVMRDQAKIMGDSLVINSRAYVEVYGIETLRSPDRVAIKIANIGHVPAEDITIVVDAIFHAHPNWKQWQPDNVREKYAHRFPYEYGHSKLFAGNLKMKLFVPINRYFSQEEITLILSGKARFIVQVRIEYRDGFGVAPESEFAFRFIADGAGWLAYPVRTPEEIERREAEEQPYYE